MSLNLRVGIDVGGTNTDAVIMKGSELLASVKMNTTKDVTSGVKEALNQVLKIGKVDKKDLSAVMIGTTHFTNAVVEQTRLTQTAVIRLALPSSSAIPPMAQWPEGLVNAIGRHHYEIEGGYNFDGRAINPLNESALTDIANELKNKGIRQVVVNCVFGPVNDDMERKAAAILSSVWDEFDIVCSVDVGRIGFLERENAALLNASLRELSEKTIKAFEHALNECGVYCPFYITQNDGTLMSASYVKKFPVLTFASGPTNSMRGAAFLSGLKDAIVVDVGGTTSDVGLLQNGFPRQANSHVGICGVRTNFRMPDMVSIGLGGGTRIHQSNGAINVGPDSVGYQLSKEALVFGGSTLTASDIAVALGQLELGDHSAVANLPDELLEECSKQIDELIIDAVESNRLSKTPIPVLAVGGGSVLVKEHIGDLKVIRPPHFHVANAVGAAIAQVSGEVDRVYSLAEISREEAFSQAEREATERAISAGATPESIEVVEKEDVPLAYLPGNATRVRLKVVGDLKVGS
ncbi:hydantoinase/oxoprolinase N-terminal domain-containing protein [Vibrio penaeicida]|uniref:hydantoinase/oxoprolinase N-terminal domain-containing protein n=1 Tax=Vibrio penaeicida TaxID=104609 RepID=UPI000CEA5535|nr:hydantoinase/oxoprolinase family protein [Vibrio penaeicida]